MNIDKFVDSWGTDELIEELDPELCFAPEIELIGPGKKYSTNRPDLKDLITIPEEWYCPRNSPDYEPKPRTYLQGMEGIESLRTVCLELLGAGCRITDACGGHTNVSYQPMPTTDKTAIARVWAEIDNIQLRKKLKQARAPSDAGYDTWCRVGSGFGKGHGLNIRLYGIDSEYNKNNRLEFRLWKGTLEWRDWASQIIFGQEFLQHLAREIS